MPGTSRASVNTEVRGAFLKVLKFNHPKIRPTTQDKENECEL